MEQKKESTEKKQAQPENKTAEQKQSENNNPPKPNEDSKEKWLYGLAGAGIGSLVTYLVMDNKNKKEKEAALNGIRERENEAAQNKVKRKVTYVLK